MYMRQCIDIVTYIIVFFRIYVVMIYGIYAIYHIIILQFMSFYFTTNMVLNSRGVSSSFTYCSTSVE
jgi:hypothetical protein